MGGLNLEELMKTVTHRTARTSDAQRKELQRRRNTAQGLARSALARLHSDDYRSLYQQALAKVNAELGPLPE